MSDFKEYPPGTRVMVKSTGEHGEAFESLLGFVSLAVDGDDRYRVYEMSDVIFLNEPKEEDHE